MKPLFSYATQYFSPAFSSSSQFKIAWLVVSITTAAYLVSHMPPAAVRVKGEFIAPWLEQDLK